MFSEMNHVHSQWKHQWKLLFKVRTFVLLFMVLSSPIQALHLTGKNVEQGKMLSRQRKDQLVQSQNFGTPSVPQEIFFVNPNSQSLWIPMRKRSIRQKYPKRPIQMEDPPMPLPFNRQDSTYGISIPYNIDQIPLQETKVSREQHILKSEFFQLDLNEDGYISEHEFLDGICKLSMIKCYPLH